MAEVVLLPEMLEAGLEAMADGKKRKDDDKDICIAVFLAMRAIEEMYVMRLASGAIH